MLFLASLASSGKVFPISLLSPVRQGQKIAPICDAFERLLVIAKYCTFLDENTAFKHQTALVLSVLAGEQILQGSACVDYLKQPLLNVLSWSAIKVIPCWLVQRFQFSIKFSNAPWLLQEAWLGVFPLHWFGVMRARLCNFLDNFSSQTVRSHGRLF